MNIRKTFVSTKEEKIDMLVKKATKGLIIKENIKLAKKLVEQNKLSEKDLNMLISFDPSPTKKYVGWLAKVWVTDKPDKDELRNLIEEFHTFFTKNKTKTKDIYQKSFKEIKAEVDELNNMGSGLSVKDLENDYETIVDNDKLLICVPHTHEASRKLGLTKFSFRSCGDGKKDSAWCTTYKAPNHFNSYYYQSNVTFYYVLVRSAELREKLYEVFGKKKGEALTVTALVVLSNGRIDAYDGLDKQLSSSEISKFRKIIGI
jgi:hypothetical protein